MLRGSVRMLGNGRRLMSTTAIKAAPFARARLAAAGAAAATAGFAYGYTAENASKGPRYNTLMPSPKGAECK
eukprot:CAMPEP_0115848694 /NCGR_PEP_ID=MMETSP0287-20121206/11059_1 /TAXON_ID=412157 /ORGANISM="Chrysochromulina rotalis, Strain UIO044" /LENGTH=71 /DNA_ID=CAMNT_0003302625 /DNA_START=28 /DNA_END=240 /DNA_ORIENTATION=+